MDVKEEILTVVVDDEIWIGFVENIPKKNCAVGVSVERLYVVGNCISNESVENIVVLGSIVNVYVASCCTV